MGFCTLSSTVFLRITDKFWLEGALKVILFQFPAMGRDAFHETRLQPVLEHFQGWDISSALSICDDLIRLN